MAVRYICDSCGDVIDNEADLVKIRTERGSGRATHSHVHGGCLVDAVGDDETLQEVLGV